MASFPYDAARWRAKRSGLAILGCHYVGLPAGVPSRDHWGNPVQTSRAWLGSSEMGRDGIGSAEAAYADIVHSIHQQSTPDAGTALAEIRRCVLTIQKYPQRADYLKAMLVGGVTADPVTIGKAWTESLDCAFRAQRTLPAELLTWLIELDCGLY